jgi:hypothetical protein
MASPTTTVTIAGPTGKLALSITKHLPKTPSVHINGLCRKPSKLPGSLATNPRITIFQATATDTVQIRSSLHNALVSICCYLGGPTLMVSGQKALIGNIDGDRKIVISKNKFVDIAQPRDVANTPFL